MHAGVLHAQHLSWLPAHAGDLTDAEDVAAEGLRAGQAALEVARGGRQHRESIRSDLGDGLARQREDGPVRAALHLDAPA